MAVAATVVATVAVATAMVATAMVAEVMATVAVAMATEGPQAVALGRVSRRTCTPPGRNCCRRTFLQCSSRSRMSSHS